MVGLQPNTVNNKCSIMAVRPLLSTVVYNIFGNDIIAAVRLGVPPVSKFKYQCPAFYKNGAGVIIISVHQKQV